MVGIPDIVEHEASLTFRDLSDLSSDTASQVRPSCALIILRFITHYRPVSHPCDIISYQQTSVSASADICPANEICPDRGIQWFVASFLEPLCPTLWCHWWSFGGLMGARKLHQGPTRARRLMGRKLVFQLPEVVNQFGRDDHHQFAWAASQHLSLDLEEEKMSDTTDDLRSDMLERLLNTSICLWNIFLTESARFEGYQLIMWARLTNSWSRFRESCKTLRWIHTSSWKVYMQEFHSAIKLKSASCPWISAD